MMAAPLSFALTRYKHVTDGLTAEEIGRSSVFISTVHTMSSVSHYGSSGPIYVGSAGV